MSIDIEKRPLVREMAPAKPLDASPAVGQALLDDLLVKTSRTFALSIPVLPEPTRREVTVAYLLFRIADTLEDSTLWTRERKLEELARFGELLDAPSPDGALSLAAGWVADPPVKHEGYVELLSETPVVLRAHLSLSEDARVQVARHTRRTVEGMSSFVAREEDGTLRLNDLPDLRAYCYAVAGIVGEMLTELFVLGRKRLASMAPLLRRDAATFGEALQLVNIIKDSASDATEGRFYLPDSLDPAKVLGLARDDLRTAGSYSLRLHQGGAPRGFVEFTVLPVLLAWAALERVEQHGPGSKITRDQVQSIVASMHDALNRDALAEILPNAGADGEPA
jgi:farnesyl-diphosphate farnesyltransferase